MRPSLHCIDVPKFQSTIAQVEHELRNSILKFCYLFFAADRSSSGIPRITFGENARTCSNMKYLYLLPLLLAAILPESLQDQEAFSKEVKCLSEYRNLDKYLMPIPP